CEVASAAASAASAAACADCAAAMSPEFAAFCAACCASVAELAASWAEFGAWSVLEQALRPAARASARRVLAVFIWGRSPVPALGAPSGRTLPTAMSAPREAVADAATAFSLAAPDDDRPGARGTPGRSNWPGRRRRT